jgi:hypothetical protein
MDHFLFVVVYWRGEKGGGEGEGKRERLGLK